MPRQVRIQYPGAIYHVMARGDRREAIFRDDLDRRMFLAVLEDACGRTGWLCHAYVLMGNHYHMVIETPEANLVAGMVGCRTHTPGGTTCGIGSGAMCSADATRRCWWTARRGTISAP